MGVCAVAVEAVLVFAAGGAPQPTKKKAENKIARYFITFLDAKCGVCRSLSLRVGL